MNKTGLGLIIMGRSRKDALVRLAGLALRVVEHLEKLEEKPLAWECSHWVGEIHSWLEQMEAVLHHVGKKTAGEWQNRIRQWRHALQKSQLSQP